MGVDDMKRRSSTVHWVGIALALTVLGAVTAGASAQTPSPPSTMDAETVIDSHTVWGLLDRDALGQTLLDLLPAEVKLVSAVFDRLDKSDRAVVALAIAAKAEDIKLGAISFDPAGRELLRTLVTELGTGPTTDAEHGQMQRIAEVVFPIYGIMTTEAWKDDPLITAALAAADATLQSVQDGCCDIVYDSYEVTITAMPTDLTPEAFLSEFQFDLNKVADSTQFNIINVFDRRDEDDTVDLGDIYDIDMAGPDNGSVIVAVLDPKYMIVQTLETRLEETGVHPEFGSRQFGFEPIDGGIRFFTRGASRPETPFPVKQVGALMQRVGWTGMVQGLGQAIASRGGAYDETSVRAWSTLRSLIG
jgi:hypothetical protein